MRDSFIFYKSFYEAISKLKKKSDKLEIFEAIFNYIFFDENPKLEDAPAMAFDLIKPQLDANNVKYENGRKGGKYGKLGGRPKTETPREPQENPKETRNENENENENVNENENAEPALPELKPFRHSAGKYNNVLLSNEEAAKLMKEFGETETKRVIERLSEHIATKKTNYRDDGHYAIICKWIREDKEKSKESKPKETSKTQNYSQREYTADDYKELERRRLLGTD